MPSRRRVPPAGGDACQRQTARHPTFGFVESGLSSGRESACTIHRLVLYGVHIRVVTTAVTTAVELDAIQGRQAIDMARTMLRASADSALHPHGR